MTKIYRECTGSWKGFSFIFNFIVFTVIIYKLPYTLENLSVCNWLFQAFMEKLGSMMQRPSDNEPGKGDDVPWWMRYAGRGVGTIGSLIAIGLGFSLALGIILAQVMLFIRHTNFHSCYQFFNKLFFEKLQVIWNKYFKSFQMYSYSLSIKFKASIDETTNRSEYAFSLPLSSFNIFYQSQIWIIILAQQNLIMLPWAIMLCNFLLCLYLYQTQTDYSWCHKNIGIDPLNPIDHCCWG